MNYIDKNFYALIEEFKNKDEIALYTHMYDKFKQIPFQTQESFESFFKQFDYWGDLDLKNGNYQFLFLKAQVFKKHYKDYVWLYRKLQDYRSKQTLFAILNNFYNFDFASLPLVTENIFKHYFDLDIIPKFENQTFVDVGAYSGDSTLDFIQSYGEKYKKIYCFDITPQSLEQIKQNLSAFSNICCIGKAVSDKSEIKYLKENTFSSSANQVCSDGKIKIETTTLDEQIHEKIGMLKMDIEGGEIKAIKGCKEHLKNDKPLLLVSVYHNNTDLFKIPKLIHHFQKEYSFYLRYYGGPLYATEIVLIALPKKTPELCQQ